VTTVQRMLHVRFGLDSTSDIGGRHCCADEVSMQVRIVSRRVIVVSILMLTVTVGSLAQTSNLDPTIADLQRQIQDMRSQMAKMQNRIADLEATNGTAETNSTTDPILPQSQTPPAEP
jgi:uncharacterized protein YlxW (UPF0749 family)